MILVVCTDDPMLMDIAAQASVGNHAVFGAPYQVFAGVVPQLGVAENLFILAHGAKEGDDGNPVIGDRNNALFLNAVQLYQQTELLFPRGYRGGVYVSACESYDPGVNSLSFAEMLVNVMQADHGAVRVYGHRGGVAGPLPVPESRTWDQAARTHKLQARAALVGARSGAAEPDLPGAAPAGRAGDRPGGGGKGRRAARALPDTPAMPSGPIMIRAPRSVTAADPSDPNTVMIQQIYSKISDVISAGSSAQSPGHSFLVLAAPGIFLDPGLDLDNVDDQYLWASVLNRVPTPTFIYGDTGQSIDSLVDLILQGKELPLVELNPAQRAKLQAALAVIMTPNQDPTPEYKKYETYEIAYYTALTAFQEAVANSKNDGIPIPPVVQKNLDSAKRNWETFGFRQKIDNAYATINNLQGLDPNNWWQKMRNRFDVCQVRASSGTFALTSTFPKYQNIFEDKGWTSFSFSKGDFENQESVKAINAGGGVSANYGLFRASAEASYGSEQGYKKSSSTNISVAAEIFRLQINRPWLDPLVFRSRAWRWSSLSPLTEPVSNGADASLGNTPVGVMTLLPTSVIIARNVVISGDFSQEEQNWLKEKVDTKASVGWGPFSISGNYNQSKDEKMSQGTAAGAKISNADPQIIGWYCSVLPMCPNPDPSLPWPTELTMEHWPEYSARSIEALRMFRTAVLGC